MSNICQAKQKSDSMVCTHCNLAWDVNDKNPPNCEFDLHFDKSEMQPTMNLRIANFKGVLRLQQMHIIDNPITPAMEIWVNVPLVDVGC